MAAKAEGNPQDINPDVVIAASVAIVFVCVLIINTLFPEKPLTDADVHFDLITQDRTVFCASPDGLREARMMVSFGSPSRGCSELPGGFKLISRGPADGMGNLEVAALHKGKLSYFYVSGADLKRLP
jgi:hypothetical protein